MTGQHLWRFTVALINVLHGPRCYNSFITILDYSFSHGALRGPLNFQWQSPKKRKHRRKKGKKIEVNWIQPRRLLFFRRPRMRTSAQSGQSIFPPQFSSSQFKFRFNSFRRFFRPSLSCWRFNWQAGPPGESWLHAEQEFFFCSLIDSLSHGRLFLHRGIEIAQQLPQKI